MNGISRAIHEGAIHGSGSQSAAGAAALKPLRDAERSGHTSHEGLLLVLGGLGMAGFLGIHLAFAADLVTFRAYCVISSLSLGAYVSSLVAGQSCFDGSRSRRRVFDLGEGAARCERTPRSLRSWRTSSSLVEHGA